MRPVNYGFYSDLSQLKGFVVLTKCLSVIISWKLCPGRVESVLMKKGGRKKEALRVGGERSRLDLCALWIFACCVWVGFSRWRGWLIIDLFLPPFFSFKVMMFPWTPGWTKECFGRFCSGWCHFCSHYPPKVDIIKFYVYPVSYSLFPQYNNTAIHLSISKSASNVIGVYDRWKFIGQGFEIIYLLYFVLKQSREERSRRKKKRRGMNPAKRINSSKKNQKNNPFSRWAVGTLSFRLFNFIL